MDNFVLNIFNKIIILKTNSFSFKNLKMSKINITFLSLVIFVTFTSCNSRHELEKKADERLKHVEKLINSNSLNAAKIEIDTINLLYPRLIDKRKIAAAFKDSIARLESSRS